MKKGMCLIFLCLLLSISCASMADAYEKNKPLFETRYSQEIGSKYTESYKVGDNDKHIGDVAQRLKELGYNPVNRIENTYTETLIKALRLFSQQMQIGETTEITPLLQAVLFSADAQPAKIAVPRIGDYSKGGSQKDLVTYDYKSLQSAKTGDHVAIQGKIVSLDKTGISSINIQLAIDAENEPVSVAYIYPGNTSEFLAGDSVIVLGSIEAASDYRLCIKGDLIGFSK
jgi:hypothetical protein